MPIKKRNVTAQPQQPKTSEEPLPSFPNIEAKPKKKVGDHGFFQGHERLTGPFARRFGPVAQACGDTPETVPITIADRFKLLRTPYDETTATEQRYRNRVRNRQTAITAMCVVCTGSRKLVTECAAVTCPLWAFRFGRNPYRGK